MWISFSTSDISYKISINIEYIGILRHVEIVFEKLIIHGILCLICLYFLFGVVQYLSFKTCLAIFISYT